MATSTKDLDGRTAALTAVALVLLVALTVAWRIDAEATTRPAGTNYSLTILDESGAPIVAAAIASGNREWLTDASGTVTVELTSPALFVIEADGMIPDAVVLGSTQRIDTNLRLLARTGPNGERTVMHFGGDFMMGRRYLDPAGEGPALVTDEASAEAVVSDIAPLFGLADMVSVNYESVAGTLSPDDAYAGKRFLLQSPPETMAALDALGVDVATLGNNHINDWLGAGVTSTIRNLEAAGIAHPGGGSTEAEALEPAIVDTSALSIGVVSMTTVTGDYVNDSLPSATAPIPASLPAEDLWQYEIRTFGFGSRGDANHVPTAGRRPGAVWAEFTQLETELPAGDAADLWMAVSRTYPELQDWVARRGHGGAARFSREAVAAAIAAARAAGAEFVVVQIHGGLQFADVSSDYFRRAAHQAVDEGADLVIGHHPHVLQGFEYYDNTLIAHSLGNFVFDQEFLVTHPSVVLRTVYEGTRLVEAKLYPVIIDDYRPVPVGGAVADMILDRMNLASLQGASSIRLPDRRVGATRTAEEPTAEVVNIGGRGVIVPVRGTSSTTITLEATIPERPPVALGSVQGQVEDVIVGRDLFGFGDLEDGQADGRDLGGLEWVLPPDSMEIDQTSPAGPWTVRLDRTSQHLESTFARIAATVPLPRHRWFEPSGNPADGIATYSIRIWAKRVGAGIPFVRVSFYEFDDTDPTRAPESAVLETTDLELSLVNDGNWHELWIDMPQPPPDANTALVAVGLAPPESRSGSVWLDGLEIVEWRSAAETPPGTWSEIDYLEAPDDRTITVAVRDTP
jgi:poly-gamma-glutamate capsule biosynthesis protein CapA/YwtB (metallophosphatase superfamily)